MIRSPRGQLDRTQGLDQETENGHNDPDLGQGIFIRFQHKGTHWGGTISYMIVERMYQLVVIYKLFVF